MKTINKGFIFWLLALTLCGGCQDRSRTIRQGQLSYNSAEVFRDSEPARALANAAASGDVKEINRLARSGANVNFAGQHEITPLWWAAWAENYNGFRALLDAGANPNAQRKEGYPIMYLIADVDDPRFLDAALKCHGDPDLLDVPSGETPLFVAVQNGRGPQIESLLGAKANVRARLPVSGMTANASDGFPFGLPIGLPTSPGWRRSGSQDQDGSNTRGYDRIPQHQRKQQQGPLAREGHRISKRPWNNDRLVSNTKASPIHDNDATISSAALRGSAAA